MKNTINPLFKIMITIFIIIVSVLSGYFANQYLSTGTTNLISPFVSFQENTTLPLLAYSIENIKSRKINPSAITIENLLSQENKFDSYIFSFTTLGKKMTGQINIPDNFTQSPLQKHSAIIMIRGYVPEDIYKTGMGTESAAKVLAENGYITVAPDFFGFGDSDPEPNDTWQARFEKPIIIRELIETLEIYGVPNDTSLSLENNFKIDNVGIWAHSNGGQIALSTLETLDIEIPTSLWAPVTAPFPYSILYFGDELEDEGKAQRKWLSLFEEKYNVFDFSLTQHLDLLNGPIQIQHGDADDSALIFWSEEFIKKIELENVRRSEIIETESSTVNTSDFASSSDGLSQIDLTFYKYENTNHNMIPNWNKAIARDVQFFDKYLKKALAR